MKRYILLILLFVSALSLSAQFTNTGAKFLLNYQTDSKGLSHFGSGVPTYTPEDRFDTWQYQDTTKNNIYHWNDAASEWECFYFFSATTPSNVVGPPAVSYDRSIWYNTTNDSIYAYFGAAWSKIGVGGGGGPGSVDTIFLSIGPGDGYAIVSDTLMILAALGLDTSRDTGTVVISLNFGELPPYNGQLADTTEAVIYDGASHRRISPNQLYNRILSYNLGETYGLQIETPFSNGDDATYYLRFVSPVDSMRVYGFDGKNYIVSSSDLILQAQNGAVTINGDSIYLSTAPTDNAITELYGPDPVTGKLKKREISTISGGGSSTFSGLSDTPNSYSGEAGKIAAVNSGEDAIEFVEAVDSLDNLGNVDVSDQESFSVLRSDGSTWTAQQLGSNHSLRQHTGIVAHIGDSNTNGRPGWRKAYLQEWFGEDELFEGWDSYNIANNGSTLAAWAAATATPSDSILIDACTTGAGCGYEADPGVIPYRIVNGDSTGKKPDVVLICLGTNDLNSPTGRAGIGTETNLRTNLNTLVKFVLDSTNAFVLLRMPQPFVHEDFMGITQWVDSLEVLEANRRIKTVYREWIGKHPRVDVYDTHAQLFQDSVWRKDNQGLDPVTGGAMLADALHSTNLGYKRICQGISHQLTNGRQLFPTETPIPHQFPEDFFRYATWGANMHIKTGTAYSDDSQTFEVYASQQQSVLGRYYNSLNSDGEPYIRKRDIIKAAKLSPQATYQSLLSLDGEIYLYHYATGTTHTIENPAQSQWVTASPPNYAQVSADFTGTGTLATGEYLVYSKSATPFSGNIGPGVEYDPGNQGIAFSGANLGARLEISNPVSGPANTALRVAQAVSGSMIYLNGTANGTNGIFMDMDGTGYVLDAQIDNGQTKKVIETTMSQSAASYQFNNSFVGVNHDYTHNLDNYSSTGLRLRMYNGRSAKGNNNNTVTVFDVAGGASAATDITSRLINATIVGTNTKGLILTGASGQTANIVEVQANGGTDHFVVEGDGDVIILDTLYRDNAKTIYVPLSKKGITTDTTDGDGEITILHGATFTPSWAGITVLGDNDYRANIVLIDGTNLVVLVTDSGGADVTSTSVTVHWEVSETN